MKVRFYSFAKRTLETLTPPSNTSYTELEVRLKDGCEITKPILLCQTVVVAAFNYAYIQDFNRYYFVSESMSIEGMWQVALVEDYLASYKAAIGNTIANILYASGSTKNIPDSRIPVTADLLLGHSSSNVGSAPIVDSSFGSIVLGITGKGSFGNYIIGAGALSGLVDGVDNWWSTNVTDQLEAFKQFFFGGSAIECLKSAIALPFSNIVSGTDISESIVLGGYPTGTTGYRILDPIINFTGSISIPWQSNDWKRVAAYTSIIVYLPFAGLVTIPATEAQTDGSIDFNYSLNKTSGDISIELKGSTSSRIFAVASGNCAMNTAYGSTGIDTNRATTAIASGIGTLAAAIGVAAGGGLPYLAAAGAGLAATAGNTLQALGGNSSGSGGLGGGSNQGLDKQIHCFVAQKKLSDTQANFDAIMGKPYMSVGQISNFSGYVQTDGFQLSDSQAYSSEKDIINKLMDQGIYYT